MRLRAGVTVALTAAALLAGCGLGAGDGVGGVSVIVTRDFGSVELKGSPSHFDAPGGETAMRALQRKFEVTTRYGGGFVQSIGGVAGGTQAGRPVDWFFYVNGVEASRGAAATGLNRGDVVWWDHHDWAAANRVPAVVGAFPEPFKHGIDGRRLPARVECAPGSFAACRNVEQQLGEVGVVAGEAALGTRGGAQLVRVLVGPWSAVRTDFAARLLGRGPGASGVYARPAQDGRSIAVLDARGRVVRTLGAGSGLVAATRDAELPPVWVVTGTDAAGVALAAAALTADALRGRFALALTGDGPIALPQVAPVRGERDSP